MTSSTSGRRSGNASWRRWWRHKSRDLFLLPGVVQTVVSYSPGSVSVVSYQRAQKLGATDQFSGDVVQEVAVVALRRCDEVVRVAGRLMRNDVRLLSFTAEIKRHAPTKPRLIYQHTSNYRQQNQTRGRLRPPAPPPDTLDETYATSGPLAPLCENMTSSTKTEVHSVLHCYQMRTELRQQITCTEKFVNFGVRFLT